MGEIMLSLEIVLILVVVGLACTIGYLVTPGIIRAIKTYLKSAAKHEGEAEQDDDENPQIH